MHIFIELWGYLVYLWGGGMDNESVTIGIIL